MHSVYSTNRVYKKILKACRDCGEEFTTSCNSSKRCQPCQQEVNADKRRTYIRNRRERERSLNE